MSETADVGTKQARTAFVVIIEEDGSALATNAVGDLIVYLNDQPMLLDLDDRCDPQVMLRAAREVVGDLEAMMLTQRVVPSMMHAMMQQAQQAQEAMTNQKIASKLHVPGN